MTVDIMKNNSKLYNDNFRHKHEYKIKEKIKCEVCGGTYTYFNKSKHNNTTKHINSSINKNITHNINNVVDINIYNEVLNRIIELEKIVKQ